jgi:3-oxoacyl-[acyl-carrier-protein] synthase-3
MFFAATQKNFTSDTFDKLFKMGPIKRHAHSGNFQKCWYNSMFCVYVNNQETSFKLGATIVGSGKALPALNVVNDSLQALVDTNDEWISSRTGIKSRHIAITETNSDLACVAALRAMGQNGEGFTGESLGWTKSPVSPDSIDLVVYATITPDVTVPSAAALLKRKLGLTNAVAFDINAACTGFIYGLSIAQSMMAASNAPGARTRKYTRALVIGSERLTRLTNWEDRSTCVLFGDGAGAAVLEWDSAKPGIISSVLVNEDDEKNSLTCPNNFTAPFPFDEAGPLDASAHAGKALADPAANTINETLNVPEEVARGAARQTINMEGQAVFKFASRSMGEAITQVCAQAEISLDEVALIVPHQANERIIKYAAKRLGLPLEKFQLSMDHTGNTSSASVPMALADAYANSRICPGDKVIVVAFGGGLTYGACLFEA